MKKLMAATRNVQNFSAVHGFEADEASFIATPAKYLGVIRAWLLATNENRHSWDVELCLIPPTN